VKKISRSKSSSRSFPQMTSASLLTPSQGGAREDRSGAGHPTRRLRGLTDGLPSIRGGSAHHAVIAQGRPLAHRCRGRAPTSRGDVHVTSFQEPAHSRKRERISHFSIVHCGRPPIFEEQNPRTLPLYHAPTPPSRALIGIGLGTTNGVSGMPFRNSSYGRIPPWGVCSQWVNTSKRDAIAPRRSAYRSDVPSDGAIKTLPED
jgi:hypothetical protein